MFLRGSAPVELCKIPLNEISTEEVLALNEIWESVSDRLQRLRKLRHRRKVNRAFLMGLYQMSERLMLGHLVESTLNYDGRPNCVRMANQSGVNRNTLRKLMNFYGIDTTGKQGDRS